MDGIDTKLNGEARKAEHLPTPSATPEPEDVASSSAPPPASEKGMPVNSALTRENVAAMNGNRDSSISSSSRRPSTHLDEAILSDSSEKARPPPQIKRPGDGRRKSSLSEHEKMLKLSPKQIHELTSERTSIPVRAATPIPENVLEDTERPPTQENKGLGVLEPAIELSGPREVNSRRKGNTLPRTAPRPDQENVVLRPITNDMRPGRPALPSRATSTPPMMRRKPSGQRLPNHAQDSNIERSSSKHVPPPLNLHHKDNGSAFGLKPAPRDSERSKERHPSPRQVSMPLPPFSIATFLSLELAPDAPSPLYIYRPSSSDFPYESSKIKYDRLVNIMLLPPKLESVLGFGAFACLDAWMHVLTILPLRFLLAVIILVKWWGSVILKEIRDLWSFVYNGLGRLWARRGRTSASHPSTPVVQTPAEELPPSLSRQPSASTTQAANPATAARENGDAVPMSSTHTARVRRPRPRYRHRRTKSTPSALLPSHKADILKGLLVIASCAILMRFDASRMYHGIRGQSAIKLYVIYNVLEVCDRLLSAVGQDVLECLFSRETLDRDSDGRSKVLRPFWMFVIALVYNVAHATALFYQVITLNVAVNSYSNALLTLLLSNQFVEIKGTVFKKFEKENLFQITCADIVERFQLWLMLLIIGMRNVIEMGGLSSSSSSSGSSFFSRSNTTAPFTASSIIPLSFTVLPKWTGQVLNPFLLVLGSEMLVDWLKHAYITKFNQTKPNIYDKFFDVLAKDYYSDAFVDQNLTRRLGLPVLPLSCLFIRAAIQTYHMFIAIHLPPPMPSTATSLATSATASSPTTTHALARIDQMFRRAISQSTFNQGSSSFPFSFNPSSWISWTSDDFIAFSTMICVFLIAYVFFLVLKIALGMSLLRVSRDRYKGMKERERMDAETGGKKLGGWGVVDVDEDKRKWIYNDDPEGLKRLKERDVKSKRMEDKERSEGASYGHVSRYSMVAKRIW